MYGICLVMITGLVFSHTLTANSDLPAIAQPTGLQQDSSCAIVAEDVVVKGVREIESQEVENSPLSVPLPEVKEDTAKEEEEPVLQPLVLAGSGAMLIGTGAAVGGIFGSPILFLVSLLFFAGGAWLTAIGWKKIKAEPKKYKGEKIAVINYLVMGIIGVTASFYSLYILFNA